MADTLDLKSSTSNSVRVRLPFPAHMDPKIDTKTVVGVKFVWVKFTDICIYHIDSYLKKAVKQINLEEF